MSSPNNLRARNSLRDVFKDASVSTGASQNVYYNILFVRQHIVKYVIVKLVKKDKLVMQGFGLERVNKSFMSPPSHHLYTFMTHHFT